ncbi:MAG: DUF1553 domain-containing protein [Aeoliella sp.]
MSISCPKHEERLTNAMGGVGLRKWALLVVICLPTGVRESQADIDFNRQIAPILAEHCFECHGPDSGSLEASLRLDTREGAFGDLPSGNRAIVPGELGNSQLIERVTTNDQDLRMPPHPAEPLHADQIRLLKQWIEAGARYETHWSFSPLATSVPNVVNSAWPNGAIDRFVLHRLEERNLHPAPEADRRTLIRRLYFDLLGLPPSPTEVDSFLQDARPDAFERLVDRLLKSPHYGERWGRHWLDVARYGDSNGGDENHAYPFAFEYRDYVIRALNADVPYDRFVAEQLAGDLIGIEEFPERSNEKLIGTGFLAIGMKILAEQDAVKKRADLVDERLDTIGKALLGLSIGCARCHDHKFDPIPTNDYYALAGILHSTDDQNRIIESKEYRAARDEHANKIAAMQDKLSTIEQELGTQGDHPSAINREAESFERGNVIVDKENYGATIGIISDPGAQDNYVEYDFEIRQEGEYVLALRYAAQEQRPGRLLIDGEVFSEIAISHSTGSWFPDTQTWFVEEIVTLDAGSHVLRIESKPMMSHLDCWRLTPVDPSSDVATKLNEVNDLRTLLTDLSQQAPKAVEVMAVTDGEIRDVQIHRRGSHIDLGVEIPRQFLSTIGLPRSEQLPLDHSGRAELAGWITDPERGAGALAARVIVNRLWHWHFGRGLSDSPNNFGTMGNHPSHPELLDWLAIELIQHDWSLKHVHRQIVTSNSYRMASSHNDDHAIRIDPDNRLMWRRDPHRLEAEAIRDAVLSVAGQLDLSVGGRPPSVKSANPSPADMDNNQATYQGSRRRSVYLPVVRTNVYDFLTLFDFPNAASSVGRRSTTTVPTQALLLMNDPFLIEQANHIASGLQSNASLLNDAARVDFLYQKLFARPPQEKEQEAALSFLDSYAETADGDDDARRHKSWAAYCHTLLMSHEFIYIN